MLLVGAHPEILVLEQAHLHKRQQSGCTFLVYMEPQEYLGVVMLEVLEVASMFPECSAPK
jgi:hypothetical protein